MPRLYNEDCVEGARRHIADGTVDLILTDPPYGIGGDKLDKHYNRDESFVVGGYVEVPEGEYGEFSREWIGEAVRILRPGGSIYIVSGYTNLHHVLNALHSTDLYEVNHLIWKYNFGVHTTKKYVSSHYHILFWQKPGGAPTFNTYCRYGDSETGQNGSSLNYLDREDVFVINREYQPGEAKNKNELPWELLSKLISYSSNPGDTVCDMFLGGFSTAIVAKGMGREPIGFEISKNAFDMGMERFLAVEEGEFLGRLRVPAKNRRVNGGKPWTDEERGIMAAILGTRPWETKKDAIGAVCEALGRGKWGVENEMKRLGLAVAKPLEAPSGPVSVQTTLDTR